MTYAYSVDERNAMRAYLQRAEVRLSTMHRVASAFLGGAGLLILFPVFFNEAIASLLKALVVEGRDSYRSVAAFLLGGPLLLSLLTPLFALFLLLRDLVHFYFVGHSPGFPTSLFNPRFVLSGIAFSPDESEQGKKDVQICQYSTDLINFILPFGETQAAYYDHVIVSTRHQILPQERSIERLCNSGVLARTDDDHLVFVQALVPEKRSTHDIDRFNAALGLAGTKDRDLIGEVAKAEASLVRHATGLRRLLPRYIKALLMFIVTTLLAFFIVALVDTGRLPPLRVIAVGYLVWAILTPLVVRLPVRWVYDTGDLAPESVVQKRQSTCIV
ncbi:MAG: hypothetical protein IPM94_12650 [bacterium]|nr:hypothetical protein [bacterium]